MKMRKAEMRKAEAMGGRRPTVSAFSLSALRFPSQRAFTLVEMMVVIVLIAILAAAIIPQMAGSFGDALLRSSGRDLVNVFDLASSRAVSLDQRCRVRLDPQSGQYTVEREIHDGTRLDFVPLKDVSGAEGKVDSRIAIEITLPGENASEDNSGFNPPEQNSPDTISFYPDGTADAAEIRLRDRDGFQLRLQLNPVTARVHVTAPQHE
jgi:prepilin-type N-terminal cleavage/methylation domain-containing protein